MHHSQNNKHKRLENTTNKTKILDKYVPNFSTIVCSIRRKMQDKGSIGFNVQSLVQSLFDQPSASGILQMLQDELGHVMDVNDRQVGFIVTQRRRGGGDFMIVEIAVATHGALLMGRSSCESVLSNIVIGRRRRRQVPSGLLEESVHRFKHKRRGANNWRMQKRF